MTETPERPAETRVTEVDDLLDAFQRVCEDVTVANERGVPRAGYEKERAILRNALRARLLAEATSATMSVERAAQIVEAAKDAVGQKCGQNLDAMLLDYRRLRASSLGEPVSQKAPHGARMIARDLKRLLDEEAEMFKPGRQHHNGPRRVVLDVEVHRGAQLVAFVEGFASRSAFSGIPRTENEPTSACECLDATHPEFCHSGPAHRGWCDMYAMATDPARASVISSASPLTDEEALLVQGVRGNVEGGWDTGDEAGLLKIVDRLSASAPSPEDTQNGGMQVGF